jgi:hypothetical protein
MRSLVYEESAMRLIFKTASAGLPKNGASG